MLPSSPIIRMFLLLMVLIGGIVAFSYTIGADSTLGSTTHIIVEKASSALEARMESLNLSSKLKEAKFLSFLTRESNDDNDHAGVRDACIKSMFFIQSGDHFSQSRWGAQPVPYQFKGLEIGKAETLPLSEIDAMNHIDERLFCPINVETYRFYTSDGWSPWKFDPPPKLDGITLIHQEGIWKIGVGANRAYSVN